MSDDTAAVAKAGVCPDDADQRLPAAITHAPVFLPRQQRPPRPPVHARSSSSWTPDGLLAKDTGYGLRTDAADLASRGFGEPEIAVRSGDDAIGRAVRGRYRDCLLYTSDAADE